MQIIDIVKAFEDDLLTKSGLPPIENSSRPNDSVSMRVSLNNPDELYLFISNNATQYSCEINVQVSAPRGTNKYTMLNTARALRDKYNRLYTWQAENFIVNLQGVTTSSIYQDDSHENINVIFSLIAFAE